MQGLISTIIVVAIAIVVYKVLEKIVGDSKWKRYAECSAKCAVYCCIGVISCALSYDKKVEDAYLNALIACVSFLEATSNFRELKKRKE